MKYCKDRHIDRLVASLLRRGWEFRRGGRHGRIVSPLGYKVYVPCTPSDKRAYLNFRAEIRRALKNEPGATHD